MTRSSASTPSSGSDTAERPFRLCSLVSEASGEDPAGSAWSTDRYLLVELPLPWGYDVLAGERAPAGLKELVHQLYAEGKYWGLIGMAPDPEYSRPGLVRVIDLRLPPAPFRGYHREEYLFPADQLVASLRSLADEPDQPSLAPFRQPASGTRDVLVCTHGAVDACCATFGYPVYRQLRRIADTAAGRVRVWRCTHFGGHRFAATVLDMPEGRYWGHLKEPHLEPLIRRDGPMADLRPCYRGWAALPHPLQQVAEAEAFVHHGWAWTDWAISPSEPPDQDATDALITFGYTDRSLSGSDDVTHDITIEVTPGHSVMSQHSSKDPQLTEARQFSTRIREPNAGVRPA